MAKISWSKEQQKVIDLRDSNILVSAGAGAGKTAVLVERIIQRVMDKDNPVNIDQFVIVTFTNAAAAEMRERIGKALYDALEKDPDNVHLQRQAVFIHNAKISTIHKFCGYVIQNYFHREDMDPFYRVIQGGEASLLFSDVVNALIEEKYQEGNEDFLDLVDSSIFDKNDDELAKIISTLYYSAMSNPYPKEWLLEVRKILDGTEFLKDDKKVYVDGKKYINTLLAECLESAKSALQIAEADECFEKYIPVFESHVNEIEKIYAADHYEERHELFMNLKLKGFTGVRAKAGADAAKKNYIKCCRKFYKSELEEIAGYYDEPEEQQNESIFVMAKKLITIIDLTLDFMERFDQEKRERSVVDFNDLEQMALKILVKKDEKTGNEMPTEAAKELANYFDEIMIDEYQDSNMVQETILKSVSKEMSATGASKGKKNRFMVGDIKQSIYRFRQARPDLFLEKQNSYKEDGDEQRIDLSENYRSRELIISFVNFVFRNIMNGNSAEVRYDSKAELVAKGTYPETDLKHCETIEIHEVAAKKDKSMYEAYEIAKIIEELMDGNDPTYVYDKEIEDYRPCQYRDIVILARSVKNLGPVIGGVFEAKGIPYNTEKKEGFYQTKEIQMIINMFAILDNPKQDIPLVAVLHGPMFEFTDEELALIRGEEKKGSFYDALVAYTTNENAEENLVTKIQGFLELLMHLRGKLEYSTITGILREIYDITNVYDKVLLMPEADKKIANLEVLMKQAADFDGTTYKGLHQFMRYLEKIESNNVESGEANLFGDQENIVRIMTIHKSKGLEFPVCIVAGMNSALKLKDSSWLKIHPKYGIASETIDNEKRYKKDNFFTKTVEAANYQANLQEELRVLYVALTRAKEKLYLVGSIGNKKEFRKEDRIIDLQNIPFDSELYRMRGIKSFGDMVFPVVLQGDFKEYKYVIKTEDEIVIDEAVEKMDRKLFEGYIKDFDETKTYDEAMKKKMEEMAEYSYPGETEFIPAKVSVSDLKIKSLEDEQNPAHELFDSEQTKKEEAIPEFIKKKQKAASSEKSSPENSSEEDGKGASEETENQEISGSAYGTMMHQFMATVDFSAITCKDDIINQMTELIKSGKINKLDEKTLRRPSTITKIWRFFESPLGKRMQKAFQSGNLYREQPYVLAVPVSETNLAIESDETVLIQGIIDGFFVEDDRVVLMDYKTDGKNGLAGDTVEEKSADLLKRYQTQIDLYQRAIEEISGKKVSERFLYSFSMNCEIPM